MPPQNSKPLRELWQRMTPSEHGCVYGCLAVFVASLTVVPALKIVYREAAGEIGDAQMLAFCAAILYVLLLVRKYPKKNLE